MVERVIRDYHLVADRVEPLASKSDSMRRVVDAIWLALHDTGISWIGFYVDQPDAPDDRRLRLGPCRDKPACTPIGLHGVCGQALLARQTRIVRDVRELGESYIACDPRDRAEIVIPLLGDDGACWGVLDVDSHAVGAFDESDDRGLRAVLAAAGLLHIGDRNDDVDVAARR